jgi:hypothetical protein
MTRAGMARADALALHAPFTSTSHGMIDRDELVAMKPGAVLINTGRGALADPVALAEALRTGAIAGAAARRSPVAGRRRAEPTLYSPLGMGQREGAGDARVQAGAIGDASNAVGAGWLRPWSVNQGESAFS